MKKNKMMRVAAVMLVCVLLSTSIISGTFAKYVTAKSVEDTARVAKWGVEVTADGTLFETNYDEDAYVDPANSVISSSSEQKVVAPGTANDVGMTFSVSGKPEVSVRIYFEFLEDTDVCLPAGTYTDFTDLDSATGTFTLTADYHPLKYTLKHNGSNVTGCIGVPLSTIKTYLEGTTVSRDISVSTIKSATDLSADTATMFGTYTLTWEWPFGENDHTGDADLDDIYNKADTFLGQYIAGVATDADATITGTGTIETGADVSIRLVVTQLD